MGIVNHDYTVMGKTSFQESNCHKAHNPNHKAHSTDHLTDVDAIQSIFYNPNKTSNVPGKERTENSITFPI